MIRHAVDDLLAATGLDQHRRFEVRLAVTEVAANAVLHGSTNSHDVIDLDAELQNDTLTVTIRDYGQNIASSAPLTGLGLGVQLVFTLADHTEISHAHPGTRVTLHFAI